jgi:hypothetical protein
VLIRGSNLDKPLSEGAINLTTGGLQRRRVLWVQEMSEEEIRQVGDTGPTIDSIQVAEFESQDASRNGLAECPCVLALICFCLSNHNGILPRPAKVREQFGKDRHSRHLL